MGRIIAVTNQKGGVGKTTTCVNTAYALHLLRKRVLLCDFDPQGSATTGMGLSKKTVPSTYDAITRLENPKKAVHPTAFGDVMPAGITLAGAEAELHSFPQGEREYRLRSVLEALREDYDYILIDCPPSLGMLTINALCASDSFLIPVQCEFYALEGLTDLLGTVRMVRQGGLNASLEIEGVLLTMFDARTNLSVQVADEVKRHFPGKLYKTVVPRNVRLSEAPSHGMPVQKYDPGSKGSESYAALADEIIRKGGAKAK